MMIRIRGMRGSLAQAVSAALILTASYAIACPVEAAFSPDGGALQLVIRTIDSAHTSLRMAAYSFTSRPVADALVRAGKRSVDVRVVADKSNRNECYSEVGFLLSQGVPVRLDYRYAIMHDKFIVGDGATAEEGSFNYTSSADRRNAENVLVLKDSKLQGSTIGSGNGCG